MRIFLQSIVVLLLIFSVTNPSSAQLTKNDIYLLTMQNDSGKFKFGEPVKVNERSCYNNQPRFDNYVDLLYYTSQPDSTQTEIYLYNIGAKRNFQATRTPESEYSPFPLKDNKYIGCVRVDADSSQYLYTYARNGNFPKKLITDVDSVGYFCAVDKSNFVLFVLGKKNRLILYNLDSAKVLDTIAVDPGRCIQNIPAHLTQFSYTQKTSDSTFTIMMYDCATKQSSEICKSLVNSQDYAWTNDQKIFSGKNGKLYMFDTKAKQNGWQLIGDFSKSIGNFYRIAVSPKSKYIAVVTYKGKLP